MADLQLLEAAAAGLYVPRLNWAADMYTHAVAR